MSEASDERRIRKLPVTTTQDQRSAVEHAVTLWRAIHGRNGTIDAGERGEALAAIVVEWHEAARVRLQGG